MRSVVQQAMSGCKTNNVMVQNIVCFIT